MAMRLLRRCTLLQPSLFHRNSSVLSNHYLQRFAYSAGKTNHTYIVGLDGTRYGFDALQRAFECSNGVDRVIALYFPHSMERLEVELMIFGPNQATPEIKQLKNEVEKMKDETIKQITDSAMDIKNDYVNKHPQMENIIFEIKIGDPTPSAKHDLVRACYDFEADSLFLGAKGIAHSVRDKTEKFVRDHIGSVPDHCVHHAPCDVIIVKPPEY